MSECNHDWDPELDEGGNPDFRTNRLVSLMPVVYVKCKHCDGRTWLTEEQLAEHQGITELKPCPFCWGDVNIATNCTQFDGKALRTINCPNCNASMSGNEPELILAWNQRVEETTDHKPKVVVMCGSSRFCDIMAVVEWILERNELAITMGLNLMPPWYDAELTDHLAEREGCAEQMDELHLRKIDLADEIFVVDWEVDGKPYIGESCRKEIEYAEAHGVWVRYLSSELLISKEVAERILAYCDLQKNLNVTNKDFVDKIKVLKREILHAHWPQTSEINELIELYETSINLYQQMVGNHENI